MRGEHNGLIRGKLGFRTLLTNLSVIQRTSKFEEKAGKLDLNDKPTVKEFKKSTRGSCIDPMKCGSKKKKVIGATDNIEP